MANERVRRDVQSLIDEGPSGMKVLEGYATAITAMKAIDTAAGPGNPTDPRSWRFQAAIHGFPGVTASLRHPKHWGSCRHNSWFFLPWHRVYLFYFESMIQFHLDDPTWALPYWDYTKIDDEPARILPKPFRSPTTGNELFTSQRDSRVNDETSPEPLIAGLCDARDALRLGDFATDPASAAGSFAGGVVDDVTPNQRALGSLELTPHGQVHGLVGGASGLMSRFETAGLDPVFWLHHCNLDRLWEVWIAKWGADLLPTDDAWLDTEFEVFDSDGNKASKRIGDILATPNLGYVYESIDQPAGTLGPDPLRELAPAPVVMGEPELLGATSGIDLSTRAAVGIELTPTEPVKAAVAGEDVPPLRWFLRVEDVVGREPTVAAYDVYIDLPDDATGIDHPDLRVGSIPSFGIPEASDPDGDHGGTGITVTFEITAAVATLTERDDLVFDPSKVTVHIVPVGLAGQHDEGGDLHAGRISIYAG